METFVSRRRWLGWAGAAALGGLAGCAPPRHAQTDPARLRLIGEARLPYRMDFRGTVVGGLSGLDHDPSSGLWFALSDDRSDHAPARLYTLRLDVTAQALGSPELLDVITLRQPNGLPYPSQRQGGEVADPEAIRFVPHTRTLLWTSEGDGKLGLDPFLREVDLSGQHLREFSLPTHLSMRANDEAGVRNNLALEGLALTPDGLGAWVVMESALKQDGPIPTPSAPGGPCRITLMDMASGRAVRQCSYIPDAIPASPIPPGAWADNGISEILMVDAHRMLVLERAYMMGVGMSLRLYQVDTRDGSNTLDLPALRTDNHRPLRKTLVADLAQLGLSRLDNTEGMAWGPRLPNGHRTLVVVSDDNFNPLQITQFAAFEYLDSPT